MPSRFEYERAVRSSDLPPLSRLLLLTLATWADVKTGIIPARLTPSLSTLEEGTGMDRSTVRRHLNKLEAEKWVGRDRPDIVAARSKKARTRYRLTIPKGATVPDSDGIELGAEDIEARGTQPLVSEELGAHSPQAGGTQPLELGAQCTTTRGTLPLKSSNGPKRSTEVQQASRAAALDITNPIPDQARPLVDGLTLLGIHVRWPFRGNEWFPVLALINDKGVPALVDSARRTVARATTDIDSARYFMPGWGECAPLPAPDAERPPLRAVGSTVAVHQPQRPSTSDLRSNQAVEAGRRIQALADAKRQQESTR